MKIEIMDKNKIELMISGEYNSVLEAVEKNKEKMRCADLTKANLSDADLTKANLSKANLKNANLMSAALCDCNLDGAKINYRGELVTVRFIKVG